MGRRKSIDNPFAWSAAQEKAAPLLADGVLTQQQVADQVKVSRQTVGTWMQQPGYRAHVAELRKEIVNAIKEIGIANKEARLIAYNDDHQRMLALRAARGADMANVPGGESGLLVRQHKMIGSGESATMVTEYAFDAALQKAMLDVRKQVATEMGQFVQRTDLTSGNEPVKAYIAIDVDAV